MNFRSEEWDTARLTPWEKNPRDATPEDLERLKAQLNGLKQYKPLLVNEEGVVLGGNMRLRVMREMGVEKVWVSVVDAQDEKTMLEYALSDNDRAGFYLEDKLRDLVKNTPTIDLEAFKVDLGQSVPLSSLLDQEVAEVKEDEFDEAPPAVPKTIMGDIWVLGDHMVMCGDSTKLEDVERLMRGEKADLVWTDPPYNVDYEGGNGKKIQNDKMADEQFVLFLTHAFQAMAAILKPGAPFYIAHASRESRAKDFIDAVEASGLLWKQTLIWVKNSLVLGRQDYQWRHEAILYGWKPGEAHKWYGFFDKTTVIDQSKPFAEWTKAELVTLAESLQTDIIRVDKPSRSLDHPTMKPLALINHGVQNSSRGGDLVFDPFGGSGSTLMVCEQTKRRCRTMELDPGYVDVIVARWEKQTEQKAERLE